MSRPVNPGVSARSAKPASASGRPSNARRIRSVSRIPIQIDTVATPVPAKSTAMSAAILSTPAFCAP